MSSADLSASGPDPKSRYDKDVGICNAAVGSPQTVDIVKTDVYPSYHCTAWMDVKNLGSIPVKVKSIMLVVGTSSPVLIAPFGTSTPIVGLDLDGIGGDDVEIQVTGFELCQQIDPFETVRMDIDQHILQDAPQNAVLMYTVDVEMAQWNELGSSVVGDECVFTGG